MDLDLAYAQWTLGLYPHDELPALAGEAMVQGFDGPAILNLVSYAPPTMHLLTDQEVEAALLEMGLHPLENGNAALRVASHTGRRMLRGYLTPEDYAEQVLEVIRRAGYMGLPRLLNDFSDAVDVEQPDRRRLSEMAVELAWALITWS